jgi:NitT/TauT family transport system permease protein
MGTRSTLAALERLPARFSRAHSLYLSRTRPVVSLLVGILAWEVAGRAAAFRFLPPFSRVVRAAAALIVSGEIVAPLLSSLASLLAGYGSAVVFGISLGMLMARRPWIEFLLTPYLNALLATPKLALVPVLYAIFGLSRFIQVLVIFLSAFFVIALNTMRGIQTIDPATIEMARAFGAGNRQLFRRVLLPGALPLTVAGLRLAMGHAFRGMVNAEMLVALFGLGAMLRAYGGRFEVEKVFAILLVIINVALICMAALKWFERRMTAWSDLSA